MLLPFVAAKRFCSFPPPRSVDPSFSLFFFSLFSSALLRDPRIFLNPLASPRA